MIQQMFLRNSIADGSLVIAESDFCPFFMVQWSDHFLSFQGHPEWNRVYKRTLITERRALFTPRRIAAGLESLDMKPDKELFARWMLYFVRQSKPPPSTP